MATLIYPSGIHKVVDPKDKSKGFQLEELYDMLECSLIEVVHPYASNEKIAICDEEGELKENPRLNLQASKLLGFRLYGIVLICEETEFQ